MTRIRGIRRDAFRVMAMLLIVLVAVCAQARGAKAAPDKTATLPAPALADAGRSRAQDPGPTWRVFLPLVANGKGYSRFGYGATSNSVNRYPEIGTLGAHWYSDWRVQTAPPRPNGIEYVQMVRLHQKLTCQIYSQYGHDRTLCPYLVPYDYQIDPDLATIAAAAQANRGSLWLIGNEIDRRDFYGGGQDEILPEVYAVAYHDLYYHIKGADPRARIAIAGVIQATPLRLEYLTRVWNEYTRLYGTTMPVDVWNVHGFIIRENDDYGASIPPGDNYTSAPFDPPNDATHVDMGIFENQIRAFRQWMKDRGQQNKQLIVSEYGVLYPHWYVPSLDQAGVQNFMLRTFDFFLLNGKDCSLGYPADDCRLVQRWAWYSLDDNGALFGFNPYGALFDPDTLRITPTGIKYREYAGLHGSE